MNPDLQPGNNPHGTGLLPRAGSKAIGRGEETLSSLRRAATDVRGGAMQDGGHWIAENSPNA